MPKMASISLKEPCGIASLIRVGKKPLIPIVGVVGGGAAGCPSHGGALASIKWNGGFIYNPLFLLKNGRVKP